MSSLYSESYGQRGCKVRVYEPRPGAPFMLARRVNGKYHAASLGHRDAEKAKAEAFALISAVLNGQKEQAEQTDPNKLTVKALVAMYLDSEQYKDLAERQRKDKKALLEKIVDYFGPTKRVATLDDDAVRGLLRARREGTRGFGKGGQQSVYHCFAALRSVFLWARDKRTETGGRLLRDNPLDGMAKRLKVRPNPTPNKPTIRHDEFEKLVKGARKLPMYTRVFLILTEAAGRRAGAVRQLRWENVDLDRGRIHWRGDRGVDKMQLQMTRPTTRRAMRYLRVWQKHCPSQDWVFPAPRDETKVVSKGTAQSWILAAFKAAGLKRPKGLGWHGLRRKWASERRGHALTDVKEAGGWLSMAALLRYVQVDDEAIEDVSLNPTSRI